MRAEKARKIYDVIVNTKSDIKYVGDFLNPVSKRINGRGCHYYFNIYIKDPMNEKNFVKIKVSEEDFPKITEAKELSITNSGDVMVKKRDSSKVFLTWWLYGVNVHYVCFKNGDQMDFRRGNVIKKCKTNGQNYYPSTLEKGEKGYWEIKPGGTSVALVSLVIRENPSITWKSLVKQVAHLKNVPEKEAENRLTEMKNKKLLGYHNSRKMWVQYEVVA